MKWTRGACIFLVSVCLLQTYAWAQGKLKTGVQPLPGELPASGKEAGRSAEIKLAQEKFYLFVPKNYTGTQPFGLLVFMSPSDAVAAVPSGWDSVMQEKKLIFVAPQKVGNDQPTSRREALAVIAAGKLMELATIDTNRIYVSGFSGGARVASYASFAHPAVFNGVVAICGAGFCRKVDRVKTTTNDEYGSFLVDETRAAEAKARVKFVFVTGSKDFRYGNILDIYTGGFQKDGYSAKLIDVPGMGHSLCASKVLADGLAFLDAKSRTPVTGKMTVAPGPAKGDTGEEMTFERR